MSGPPNSDAKLAAAEMRIRRNERYMADEKRRAACRCKLPVAGRVYCGVQSCVVCGKATGVNLPLRATRS